MFKFGKQSLSRLEKVHPDLILIANEVLKFFDIFVMPMGGVRTRADQIVLIKSGKSETLNSKHIPGEDGFSHAIDIAPYPYEPKNVERFKEMSDLFLLIAEDKDIEIRWGGDWDGDGDTNDQTFNDLFHFEILE